MKKHLIYDAKTVKAVKHVMLMSLSIAMNVMMTLNYRNSKTKNMVFVLLI